ncbi:Uncharacterized protein DAT39_005067, partial [Clarias magur]
TSLIGSKEKWLISDGGVIKDTRAAVAFNLSIKESQTSAVSCTIAASDRTNMPLVERSVSRTTFSVSGLDAASASSRK